jgi:hypothetical protein
MAGTGDVDHVEIELLDQPIEVHVDEVETGRRAPMAEETRLDVLLLERLSQQGIVEEVNLTDRQIVGGAPVSVDERGLGFRQRAFQLSTMPWPSKPPVVLKQTRANMRPIIARTGDTPPTYLSQPAS